jgi:4-amino-4-deoxy-L-arabinose transferase-like glycosyltransferase
MKEVTYSSRSHRVMEIIAVSIIVLPFLAVLFYSDWLRMAIPTFHDGDEQIYHFPIIKSFSEQLPFPDISDYNSATGPLYHIVLAAGGRLLGLEIHSLRLLNMLFSIIGCIVFYKILRLRSDNHLLSALVSIVFSLSPYFFGSSFRLLTDNFAIMLYFASVYFLLKFSEKPNYGYWFSFCIFAMLCTVTRQVYVHIFDRFIC